MVEEMGPEVVLEGLGCGGEGGGSCIDDGIGGLGRVFGGEGGGRRGGVAGGAMIGKGVRGVDDRRCVWRRGGAGPGWGVGYWCFLVRMGRPD